MAVCFLAEFCADSRSYPYGIDLVTPRTASELRVFCKWLPRIVARAIQVGNESADDEEAVNVCGFHDLYGSRRNFLVVHNLSTP